MPIDVDPKLWPFEAIIDQGNGAHEYHQHARDNADGSVTVYELDLPGGFVERTYPKERVKLSERPWDKARRWYELYNEVYGVRAGRRNAPNV